MGDTGDASTSHFFRQWYVICHLPHIFPLGFVIYWFHTNLSPRISQQNCSHTPEGFASFICGDLPLVTCDGHRFAMTRYIPNLTLKPKT